ncbi:hypothetical protein LP419_17585 [Massilia sp. H-1]|nr:hypothetical protein LP419_17585 [Massilia sp. H-1]
MLVTSVHIPAAGKAAVHRLADDYPNLTVIDTGAMIDRFQALLAQVAAAVEFLFLFTLAARPAGAVRHAAVVAGRAGAPGGDPARAGRDGRAAGPRAGSSSA